MFEFIISILLLVYCVLREFLFMKERSKLLDRIQAKDYVEYKTMEQPVQKKKEEPKEPIEYL